MPFSIRTALAIALTGTLTVASPITHSLPSQSTKRSDEDVMSKWDLSNITLAAVRAPPVNWPLPILSKNWDGVKFNINATVDLGPEYIRQAAENGARLVAFPEVWFPGYPKGVINEDYPNSWLQKHAVDYIDNSIVAGDANWRKLVQGAIDNEVYLVKHLNWPAFQNI